MKATYEGLYFFTHWHGEYRKYSVIRELPHGDYIVRDLLDWTLNPDECERVWSVNTLQDSHLVNNGHWATSLSQLEATINEYRMAQVDMKEMEAWEQGKATNAAADMSPITTPGALDW